MPASWCYILLCRDGSYYTGCSTDLETRYGQHLAGTLGGYTSTRLPVTMVWAGEFQTIHEAISMERRIKRWSRMKKEALIRGDYNALPGLSARGFAPSKFGQYHPSSSS
jgi:predicted GIY-YIG superfamily endonuclease